MAQFASVLFDLDETLVTHDQTGDELYRGAFDHAGEEPFGEAADLWAALEGPPAADRDDQRAELAAGFASVADAHGRTVDADALARGFLAVVDYSAVSFRPGAREALAAARERGPVGLVTNGPERRQGVKLEALGLGDAFDAVVFAGDIPRRKPHRDPFDRAVRALDVPATESLFVGNSLEFDVAGAQGAGLAAAWCPTEPDTRPEGYRPEYVLETLSDLGAVLDGSGPA
jgi:putative hydrolase of the HAD superfamily